MSISEIRVLKSDCETHALNFGGETRQGTISLVTPAFRRGLGEGLNWALALQTHETLR